jgi:folate-binding protein YgfZ
MTERTPIHELTAAVGATFVEDRGWLVPANFGSTADEYREASTHAALFDCSHRGKVELTGGEAVTFLHNLSTNDITGLAIGAGCEAFLCNAKAKVIAYPRVYRLTLHDGREALWLDLEPGQAETVIKHLDHYVISEQVEFADRTREFAQFHLTGPNAHAVLERALLDAAPRLEPHQHMMRTFGVSATSHIRRNDMLGILGYDVVCLTSRAGTVWDALRVAGAKPAGLEAFELLRVEAGTPVYGLDVTENNLAMEVDRTAQAICYTKGCFLGQEPIVRARDLGHVNWKLRGLKLSAGVALPPGAKVWREGKEVGRVTSSVASPRLGPIALAYLRRGQDLPGTEVEVDDATLDGGTARRTALVTSLPFALS